MLNTIDAAYNKRKQGIRASRRREAGQSVSINRHSEARAIAAKAGGMTLVELYVGHLGSRTRTHEIVPTYNREAGIPAAQAAQDREDRRWYRAETQGVEN